MDTPRTRRFVEALWPAFVVAGVAEIAAFSLFDPVELHVFGAPLALSRQAVYTIGFLAFWAIGAISAALALVLRDRDAPVDRESA